MRPNPLLEAARAAGLGAESSSGARRRPVVILSPSPEPPEGAVHGPARAADASNPPQDDAPYRLSRDRPHIEPFTMDWRTQGLSYLRALEVESDEDNATSPGPPTRLQETPQHSLGPPLSSQAYSDEEDPEGEDAEPLFLASVQRGHQSRRRRGVQRADRARPSTSQAPPADMSATASDVKDDEGDLHKRIHPIQRPYYEESFRDQLQLLQVRVRSPTRRMWVEQHGTSRPMRDDGPSHISDANTGPDRCYELRCASPDCRALLCSRAFHANLVRTIMAGPDGSGSPGPADVLAPVAFTSDACPPESVKPASMQPRRRKQGHCICDCILIECHQCGRTVGYQSVTFCSSCCQIFRDDYVPEEFWFYEQAVVSTVRPLTAQQIREHVRGSTDSVRADFERGLVGDPVNWLVPFHAMRRRKIQDKRKRDVLKRPAPDDTEDEDSDPDAVNIAGIDKMECYSLRLLAGAGQGKLAEHCVKDACARPACRKQRQLDTETAEREERDAMHLPSKVEYGMLAGQSRPSEGRLSSPSSKRRRKNRATGAAGR